VLGFNFPIASQIESHRLTKIAKFSNDKVFGFEKSRAANRLLEHLEGLATARTYCMSPPYLWETPRTVKQMSLGPVLVEDQLDLRDVFWRIKVKGIENQSCAFNEKVIQSLTQFKEAGHTNELNALVAQQLESLKSKFLTQHVLMETDLRISGTEPQNYELDFGMINGSSLILLNHKVIAYFPERLDSNRRLHVTLLPNQNNLLSVLYFGKGFSAPGLAHVHFIGLFKPGFEPRGNTEFDGLFGDMVARNIRQFDVTLACAAFSLAFMVISWFRKNRNLVLAYVSLVLLGFAISQAIQLDHVQSTLDGQWIRFARTIYILTVMFSVFGIIEHLSRRLEQTISVCEHTYYRLFKIRRIEPHRPQGDSNLLFWVRAGILGGSAIILIVPAANLLFQIGIGGPFAYIAQYDTLKPVFALTLVIGVLLTIFGLGLIAFRWYVSEDAHAQEIAQTSMDWMLGGMGMLLYAQTSSNFLSVWLEKKTIPTLSLLLSAEATPILVFAGLVYLIARTARENDTLNAVLPKSVLDIAKAGDLDGKSPDRTASEINWIIFNDITGSTVRKLSHLAVAMQIFQSAFHKILQSYFKDTIHHSSSNGDALLLSLKAPTECRNNDPIVEKLVRCFACHRDGVRELEDSFKTILATLELENEELAHALDDRRKFRKRHRIDEVPMQFRTILTMDHYFYGFNHAMPCIDSRAIYVSMKSEKLIVDGQDGGFIIFSDLMKLLMICLPEIDRFFNQGVIDKSRCSDELRVLLPDYAYVLDPAKRAEFHDYLQKLYRGPLYLKQSPDGRQNYGVIRTEVKEACARLWKEVQSHEDLGVAIDGLPKRLNNFAEKNLVIQTVSGVAVRHRVWSYAKIYRKVRNFVLETGVPGAALIEKIQDRDQGFEPMAVLDKLNSNDPIERNFAIRFLSLARVRNAFRPNAMERKVFGKTVLKIFFSRFNRFSVESHIYLIYHFTQQPEYSQLLREHIFEDLQLNAGDWLRYLETSQAPALNGLATYIRTEVLGGSSEYRNTSIPLNEAA
jgi:hypothetical protein